MTYSVHLTHMHTRFQIEKCFQSLKNPAPPPNKVDVDVWTPWKGFRKRGSWLGFPRGKPGSLWTLAQRLRKRARPSAPASWCSRPDARFSPTPGETCPPRARRCRGRAGLSGWPVRVTHRGARAAPAPWPQLPVAAAPLPTGSRPQQCAWPRSRTCRAPRARVACSGGTRGGMPAGGWAERADSAMESERHVVGSPTGRSQAATHSASKPAGAEMTTRSAGTKPQAPLLSPQQKASLLPCGRLTSTNHKLGSPGGSKKDPEAATGGRAPRGE